MLQVGMSQVRVPDEVEFFNLLNPSSRTMAISIGPCGGTFKNKKTIHTFKVQIY
jgi:hypothetical protein